ncbi:MAG TPA: four helix bundle protein [Chthoniobacterales bacterium]
MNKPPRTEGLSAANQKKYRTFEDLELYQVAREFRKAMYQVNRQLPAFEKFELGSQIRRASVSLTNNIAEGHGRYHYLEQLKFCLNARGSLEELVDDLNVCADESYIAINECAALKEKGWQVHQVLNGYMRWLRERKQGDSLKSQEQSPLYGAITDDLDDLMQEEGRQSASTLQAFNDSR